MENVEQSLQFTELGREHMRQKAYDQAILEFRRALGAHAWNSYAHRNLSSCYLTRKQHIHAINHGFIYNMLIDKLDLQVSDRGTNLALLGRAYEEASAELYRLGLMEAADLLSKAFECYGRAYSYSPHDPFIARRYEETRGRIPVFSPIDPPLGHKIRFVYSDPMVQGKSRITAEQLGDRLKVRLAAVGYLDIYVGYDLTQGKFVRMGRCTEIGWMDQDMPRLVSAPSDDHPLIKKGIMTFVPEKNHMSVISAEDIQEIWEMTAPVNFEGGSPLNTVTYLKVVDRQGERWIMFLDPHMELEKTQGNMLDYWDQLEKQANDVDIATCYFCGGNGWRLCQDCDGSGQADGFGPNPCIRCRGKGHSNCIRCEGLGVAPVDLDSLPGSMVPPAFKELVRRLRTEGKLQNPPPYPQGRK